MSDWQAKIGEFRENGPTAVNPALYIARAAPDTDVTPARPSAFDAMTGDQSGLLARTETTGLQDIKVRNAPTGPESGAATIGRHVGNAMAELGGALFGAMSKSPEGGFDREEPQQQFAVRAPQPAVFGV